MHAMPTEARRGHHSREMSVREMNLGPLQSKWSELLSQLSSPSGLLILCLGGNQKPFGCYQVSDLWSEVGTCQAEMTLAIIHLETSKTLKCFLSEGPMELRMEFPCSFGCSSLWTFCESK